ncbi:hypothetical protein PORY_001610 [Pneumocystis oryctolagi]|uniref:Uncharacterized protein n=1 Tax=Pneumocystis oryctolagi TaxID=42067 RepID=A0ACB7CC08_9ASCO|nr:hypothetical protein PORY_001610 [Pneumocystis oryctolagi]
MKLIDEFEEAARNVKNLSSKPSTMELLKLYALYKQATEGDNNKEKPSLFNTREKYKWDSWNAEKGKSKENAMKEYIDFVYVLKEKYS